MDQCGVREAQDRDLPRLQELFALSLGRECRRDPLLIPQEGDWETYLRQHIRYPSTLLAVLELNSQVEGYILAMQQTWTGPVARQSRWRRLLRRPRPKPLVRPFKFAWVEDLFITKKGRIAGGAKILAKKLRDWAKGFGAKRVAGMIRYENIPAQAIATIMEMKPAQIFFSGDFPAPSPDQSEPLPTQKRD